MIGAMQSSSFLDALGHGLADKRIDILRQIAQGGSISQAARAVGVSYKAAWQALDTLTNLAGVPLVARAVGGVGGGGARLTPAGHELLAAADAMRQARAAVAAGLRQGDAARAPLQVAAARLSVRTSMRNQWPCTVQGMQAQGRIVRVHLRSVDDALAVVARITVESAELLGLAAGTPVQALCKATAVRALAEGDAPAAQENHWPGRATRVSRGELGDEVAAELAAGVQMVGFAPAGSPLRARSRVVMAVDESAVALAIA
ncbi:TOBE domain-containing protein [Acidovorax sp. MR-S7]|uniref:TOBE domain-containing protein n=1 Tax=Acidovorax sp. MR-S7 TaxID=1268622 RepID=UPI00037241AE|nr:TOBE domain-containing protein [Acidovorax sp. MR-S7]